MKPLEKILIPSDLSEHSRRAVLYGCWLATEQRASVVVLYVANELRAGDFILTSSASFKAKRTGRLIVS